MANPSTKAELLAKMQEGYTAFEALLAPLDSTQLIASGVNGDWSIKDILAHIATWQARATLIVQAAGRNEPPKLDPPVTNEKEMDMLNAQVFITNQARSLESIQNDFHSSFQSLYAATEALSEDDLFNPQRFAWKEGQPLWRTVEGDTFEHYPEHESMIKKWLASQRL
ncbi:MAG TPA: ClbS/DfsB family four-helix bundle protein [Ktedonobacteraceae bacterium]|nr:ClbS/DfsB family four-helix bundle protein [Ktedonobacteraceae bacterium]